MAWWSPNVPIARRNSETKKLREKLRDFENRQLISSVMKESLILPEFINTYLNILNSLLSYLINQLIHSGAVILFGPMGWDSVWDPLGPRSSMDFLEKDGGVLSGSWG